MTLPPFPSEDMHVHTTFSDGAATIDEIVARAEDLGLERVTLVDHVRRDTEWVGRYAGAVARARQATRLELRCGVEAKILTTEGALDLPRHLPGVDRVYIADHQVPGQTGPLRPAEVARAVAAGTLDARAVVESIVVASVAAMRRCPGGVLAQLFSVLPKAGVDVGAVTALDVDRLADAAATTGTALEVSERWRCPAPWVVRRFREAGVEILASSDSHELATLGRFEWAQTAWREATAGAVR